MASSRRYKLLCPIARALDRIGDRWTLLILRDLHAGPARFSDLQKGLSGIATNLLADRLQQLIEDGLAEKRDSEYGVTLYELTDLGRHTRAVLFELAMFGGRFPPDQNPRRPGNLRTIAVTLSAACERVVTPDLYLEAELVVDGEHFALSAADGKVEIVYKASPAAEVVLTTSYEPMIAAAEGEMSLEEYARTHVQISEKAPGKAAELMALLGAAMTELKDR